MTGRECPQDPLYREGIELRILDIAAFSERNVKGL